MKRLSVAVIFLAGCSPTHPVKAERWPTYALIEGAQKNANYGEFPASFFVTLAGKPMPFRGADYETPPALATANGWSVLPAFALAQPAAYVVSEVWESHPNPWVQPVYLLMTTFDPPTRQVVDGARVPIVFGVGEQSTFYSPFWEAVMVQTREPAPKEGLPDTRAVLAAASQTLRAPNPLCPITPDNFSIASTGQGPIQPITRAPINQVVSVPVRIDGATASYVNFGPDRFQSSASGAVQPTRIFFFTRTIDGERRLLELPAVLADNAVRSSYARRYDVVLDQEVVFVPAGPKWDALRAKWSALPADPNIPAAVAAAYALRVAKTSTCFSTAANFPFGCQWLDSEAAINRLEPSGVVRTEVTLTAVPVLFGGEKL